MKTRIPGRAAGACALALSACAGAVLQVQTVSPPLNVNYATVTTPISVTFDQPVNPATVNDSTFRVFGRWTGTVRGAFSFSPDGRTVTLTPNRAFTCGDQVTVSLARTIATVGGDPLRNAGHHWMFWTRAKRAPLAWTQIASFTNRITGQGNTRIYGACGADVNNDGWLDMTTVNEDSADLRVFLNRADGTGLMQPMLPREPIGGQGSPNETADFNNDGNVDICVANYNTANVSVLLGFGTGDFGPTNNRPVGNTPTGIVAMDVDGDADPDIVNGNFDSNNYCVHLNNGDGTFAAAVFAEAGANGERAMAAGDFNADGILDVAVAAFNSQRVRILLGVGNGTFTQGGDAPGGPGWQISAGDVNGDGRADVVTANSFNASGSVLMGNGAGGLANGVTYPTDAGVVASDLGDLDGDGDLDWVLSHFAAGTWRVLENLGNGVFTIRTGFVADSNASCATLMDLNNDGALDMVLTDEIADIIKILKNTGPFAPGDLNGDGMVNSADLAALLGAWGPCPSLFAPCPGDVNGDGMVNSADLAALLGGWS